MSDSDSDSDSESSKQPQLNEDEVKVLRSYLEQWDTAEPSERKKITKAASTEARTKAPVMSIRLLKERKAAYETWFRNHGSKRKPKKPPIKIGQKWTERSVIDTLRKKELLKKIQDETGAKPGTKDMINHYTNQLNELMASLSPEELEEAKETAHAWNNQGVPADVKADIARKKGDNMIHHFASEMWNRAGMRVFVVSAWKNVEGKINVSGHDYNNEYGGGESFMKTHKWDVILPEWDSFAENAFDGNIEDDAGSWKKGRQDNTYILDISDSGYPILPACDSMDLDTKKAVIRAFLTWHYRRCCGDQKVSVPWKYVIPRHTEIIPAECLPVAFNLAEPSKLRQVHTTELLQFWYNRQEDGEEHVLDFIGWWDNDKQDMVVAANDAARPTKPATKVKKPSGVTARKASQNVPERASSGKTKSNEATKKVSVTKRHRKGNKRIIEPSDDESDDLTTVSEQDAGWSDGSDDGHRRQGNKSRKEIRRARSISSSDSEVERQIPEQVGVSADDGRRLQSFKRNVGSIAKTNSTAENMTSEKHDPASGTKRAVPVHRRIGPASRVADGISGNANKRELPKNPPEKTHCGRATKRQAEEDIDRLPSKKSRHPDAGQAEMATHPPQRNDHGKATKRRAEDDIEGLPSKKSRHPGAGQAETASQAPVRVARKKRQPLIQEDVEGSPSKRTRSKTSQQPSDKRCRKPNSRYLKDYVKA
ncbi:hypothetical protein C8R48DRAFT_769738 [Suillus tomentosus]|nr:hypothetical protein C8R48DRAFT_769738 [Suillus tomentosus]